MISVIVPVYNAEKYIERCIESILAQTYSDIEVIVVNDGSTDNSKELIDAMAAKDKRIVAIHKENSGVADARNTGIDAAKGDYIGFVDADDFVEPEMYEKLLKALNDNNAEMSCCGYYQEFSDYHYDITIDEELVLHGTKDIYGRYLRQDIRNGIFDGNWNKLFKKNVVDGNDALKHEDSLKYVDCGLIQKKIRYKKIKYCEDIDFQFRVMEKCETVVCIPDKLYHYVDNEASATHSSINPGKESVLDVADGILHQILEKYPEIEEEAYAFHLTWYLSLMQEIYRGKMNDDAKRFVKRVSEKFKENYSEYRGNKYSKRLDQYYLVATRMHMFKLAMTFRGLVRRVKPSKDKIG